MSIEETVLSEAPMSGRRSVDVYSNTHISHHNFGASTGHNIRRRISDQHNSHVGVPNEFVPMSSHETPLDHGGTSISVTNAVTYLNCNVSAQSHFLRSIASSHVGSYRLHNDSLLVNMSNHVPNYGASAQVYPQRSELWYEIPRHSNSPDRPREPIGMSDSLSNYIIHIPSDSQRAVASLNNPTGHDGVAVTTADGDFTNEHSGILAQRRATRDDEAAGHSIMFQALVPVNSANVYKAGELWKSIYPSALPLSLKISGYLIVVFASAAALSSFAGLSLSTFKPNTLPFDYNHRRMMQIMHNVAVYTTGYALIGTTCHEFLRDEPSIMWMVASLSYAVYTATMILIGWRRGQNALHTDGHPAVSVYV